MDARGISYNGMDVPHRSFMSGWIHSKQSCGTLNIMVAPPLVVESFHPPPKFCLSKSPRHLFPHFTHYLSPFFLFRGYPYPLNRIIPFLPSLLSSSINMPGREISKAQRLALAAARLRRRGVSPVILNRFARSEDPLDRVRLGIPDPRSSQKRLERLIREIDLMLSPFKNPMTSEDIEIRQDRQQQEHDLGKSRCGSVEGWMQASQVDTSQQALASNSTENLIREAREWAANNTDACHTQLLCPCHLLWIMNGPCPDSNAATTKTPKGS